MKLNIEQHHPAAWNLLNKKKKRMRNLKRKRYESFSYISLSKLFVVSGVADMEKLVNCDCRSQEELLLDNFILCTGSQRKYFQMTENTVEGNKHKRKKHIQTCLTLD